MNSVVSYPRWLTVRFLQPPGVSYFNKSWTPLPRMSLITDVQCFQISWWWITTWWDEHGKRLQPRKSTPVQPVLHLLSAITHFHAPNRQKSSQPFFAPLFCWPWVYHRDWLLAPPSNVGNFVGQRGGIRGTSQKTLRWAIIVGQPNLELRHEALQVHQMRGEQRFPKQVVEIRGESAISASVNLIKRFTMWEAIHHLLSGWCTNSCYI